MAMNPHPPGVTVTPARLDRPLSLPSFLPRALGLVGAARDRAGRGWRSAVPASPVRGRNVRWGAMPKRTDIDSILYRRRADRDRAGVRVRLFRRAGVQGAEGRGLSDRAGQLEPGDDHDRPGAGRRDLYRADHPGDGRPRSSPRASGPRRCCRRWAARPRSTRRWRWPARALLERYGVELIGASEEAIAKAEDRQLFRQAMDKIGLESPKSRLVALARRGGGGARPCRAAGDHPAVLHAGRHRRRHRLQ